MKGWRRWRWAGGAGALFVSNNIATTMSVLFAFRSQRLAVPDIAPTPPAPPESGAPSDPALTPESATSSEATPGETPVQHAEPDAAAGAGGSAESADSGGAPLADSEPAGPAPQAAKPAIAELSPNACAAKLAELFPAVFTAGAAKPLKLRIQADIQARAPATFSRKSLSVFLHRHTTSTAYLKALANGPSRIDLDGEAAGEIADEHRQAAVAELERRRTAHETRRAAEREAQRQVHREAQQQAMREFAAQSDARRERAGLLRAFESTTLTLGNFCALKGLAQDELEAGLALARQEREQAAKAPPQQRPQRPEQADTQRRPQRAADERPRQRPRRDPPGGGNAG